MGQLEQLKNKYAASKVAKPDKKAYANEVTQFKNKAALSKMPRPAPRPAPKPARQAPRPSSSGRTGGVARSVPQAAAGPLQTITGPPAVPGLDQWLAGDTSYQDLLRGNQRTLGDFTNELGRQRSEVGVNFQNSQRMMNDQRTQTLEDIENEYAARGMLTSGLYTGRVADYNRDWQNQMTQLTQGNTSTLADLLGQETNFKREQSLAQEAAKQEALRRRAERYGL